MKGLGPVTEPQKMEPTEPDSEHDPAWPTPNPYPNHYNLHPPSSPSLDLSPSARRQPHLLPHFPPWRSSLPRPPNPKNMIPSPMAGRNPLLFQRPRRLHRGDLEKSALVMEVAIQR